MLAASCGPSADGHCVGSSGLTRIASCDLIAPRLSRSDRTTIDRVAVSAAPGAGVEQDGRGRPTGLVLPLGWRFTGSQATDSWAINSAVECHLHTVEVSGSNPLSPTSAASRNTPPHARSPFPLAGKGSKLWQPAAQVFVRLPLDQRSLTGRCKTRQRRRLSGRIPMSILSTDVHRSPRG